MKIAYNPETADALTAVPSDNDIIFDLAGKAIYAKGVKFEGITYSVFKKHTSEDDSGGYNGLVPVPSYTTTTTRYLREDGTWTTPPAYGVFTGATDSEEGKIGLVPAPKTTDVGKVLSADGDWVSASLVGHTHSTKDITKLTDYSKATTDGDLSTSDSLNVALGKLEYKADYAYDWIIGVTATDTDEYINKWSEIVGFLDSVKEGTDILDEFVTRKTTQTITGVKTFDSNTFILAGREQSDIKHATQYAYNWGGYGGTNNTPNYTGMYNSLDFHWYNDIWSIGNLRSGDDTTNGFGIGLKKTDNEGNLYFAPAFRITETESYINNNKVWHTGNLTKVSQLDNDSGFLTSLPSHTHSYLTAYGEGDLAATRTADYTVALCTGGWASSLAGYGSTYGTTLDISGYSTWYHRLAFRTDGKIEYWQGINTKTMSSLGILAFTSNIPTVTDYYWANVKISASSSTSTSPTFATATAGQFIANNASGPHFTGTSTAGNWAYLRLDNSSVFWDIATRSNSGSGGLWLSRYKGLDNGIFVSASSTPKVGINLSSPSDVLDVAGLIRSTANSRYLRLGPQNSSHAHYETDADISHWFNKRVEVNGVLNPYVNNSYTCGTNDYRWSNVYSVLGNFSGDQTLYGLTSTCNKSSDSNYMNSALQIREYNFGGALTDSWGIAPRLSWHWSGRVQTQIGLNSSGDLKLSKDNFTTSYLLLHAGNSSVSGGGSSGGSSITVNIGGTSKTLTIPTSLPANGGNAATANMISHSTYYYSGNVMKNSTSSDTIFGTTATANYLFPSFMESHPLFNNYADVINFTGYCKWGGTQLATEYNAINPRVAIRKYNQTRSNWGDWTEFITEKNNYKVRDSGNSNEITFHYSSGGFSSTPSWLAAWNGYDITYVAPSVLSVNYATSAGNADKLGNIDSTRFLHQVVVPNNTENDFNTFSNMTLTGRIDPTTGASLKNAPWSGSGPAGGYGVLTYLFDGSYYGTQMAWEYHSNKIYIRNRYWGGSGVIWDTTWDSLALTSDLTNYMKATKVGSYYGLTTPTGSDSDWIRTTSNGLLPYEAGGITNGHCSIGTSGWYFNSAHIITVNCNTVESSADLFVNGKSSIQLKTNDNTSAVVLNTTLFKPFDTAHNKLTLGSNTARWANTYSVLGNFSGLITSSVAEGTAPFVIASTKVNTKLNADMIDGYHIWVGTQSLYNSATKNNSTIYLIYL